VVGATGLIGRRLVAALRSRGDEAVAVSRGGDAVAGAPGVRWQPAAEPFPSAARAGTQAIVNLAGAPIGMRWGAGRKRAIRESRILSTRGAAAAVGEGGPGTLVNASGAGYYGARGDEELTEEAGPGGDFLAQTCVLWEREAAAAEGRGGRAVMLRTGVVLAAEGGGLPRLALPTRLFVGGPLSGGRQWLPWIHVEDQVGLILFALDRPDVRGPVNAVAPGAVRQREFAAALGRVLARPGGVPTPAAAVRLVMGEASLIALEGQRPVPAKALAAGYGFRYPELEPALRDVLGRGP
jgi:uncharacterized protein